MYFFYNYDIRGSVTNIINPDGQIVKGYDYDEFGGTKEKGDYAFKNDVKFTGAVHDKSANLYYMNSRFYNPNTGRFITEDTYSGNAYEPWTQHLYTYTSNNPVNFIDPTGHRAMYAINPEDETDVQRSTSLNQMKGYSAKDSYKIATAKTPKKKQKQKAIKTAQGNKEIRANKNSVPSDAGEVEPLYPSVSNLGGTVFGTATGVLENISKEVSGYVDTDSIVHFYPKTSTAQKIMPYVSTAKNLSRAFTIITTTFDVAHTWDPMVKMSLGQRIGKTALQLAGVGAAVAVGVYLSGPLLASGMVLGGGAAIVSALGAGAIDLAAGAAISYGQNIIYKKYGMK